MRNVHLEKDAAFAGRALCYAIVQLGRDDVVRIKGNQPQVEEALEEWFQPEIQQRPADAIESSEKKRFYYYPETLGFPRTDSRLRAGRTRFPRCFPSGIITQENPIHRNRRGPC